MIYIFTVCYNSPKFIQYQYLLLKKYLVNDFEYIIYDNTCTDTKGNKIYLTNDNIDNKNELLKICDKYDIKVNEIPTKIYGVKLNDGSYCFPNYDPSTRAGKSISYACSDMISKTEINDILFLIDIDMFLIKKLDLFDKFGDNDIIGIIQNRYHINYFTNQLFCFSKKNIKEKNIKHINFLPSKIDEINTDCGGNLSYLLNDQPELRCIYLSNNVTKENYIKYDIHHDDEYLDNLLKNYISENYSDKLLQYREYRCEIYMDSFLHFRAGSNWTGSTEYNYRINKLYDVLNTIINK